MNEQSEQELRRKNEALAEAVAPLVLQKKFQSLWEKGAHHRTTPELHGPD